MDEELRNFLGRHQHTMAFVRTISSVIALALTILITYKVW